MRIILASGSPRRKELLSTLIKDFEIIVSDFEETIDSSKSLEEEIKRLAYGKAKSVFTNNQDALVIGSDTIVTIDNKVLGKPKTYEHAKEMLKELSGNKHKVITGVCIYTKDKVDTFAVVSDVYFDELTDKEIEDYVLTKEPLDKAGAYAVQGLGSKFINRIDGDYYAIMGLPVNELYKHLKQYNLTSI